MSGKRSTPRRRQSAAAAKRRASARTHELATFRERLQHLVQLHGGSRTAFAKLLGVGTSHVSKWCDAGTAPTASILHRIAERTGVSIDWLLGYDVPLERGQRAAVGTVADYLFQQMRYSATSSLHEEVLDAARARMQQEHPTRPAEAFVQTMTSAWWHAELAGRVRLWRDRLTRLAMLLESESRNPAHGPSDADVMNLGMGFTMQRMAAQLRDESYLLERHAREDEYLAWQRLELLNVTAPLRALDVELRTPFDSLGGQGLTYRGRRADYAWFLNPDTGDAEIRAGGRFLISDYDELPF